MSLDTMRGSVDPIECDIDALPAVAALLTHTEACGYCDAVGLCGKGRQLVREISEITGMVFATEISEAACPTV